MNYLMFLLLGLLLFSACATNDLCFDFVVKDMSGEVLDCKAYINIRTDPIGFYDCGDLNVSIDKNNVIWYKQNCERLGNDES